MYLPFLHISLVARGFETLKGFEIKSPTSQIYCILLIRTKKILLGISSISKDISKQELDKKINEPYHIVIYLFS